MKIEVTEKIQLLNGHFREQFKEENFTCSLKIAISNSELAKKETNDCVVRAFMCALDIPYDEAHAFIKRNMAREDRKGTYTSVYAKNVIGKVRNNKKITFIGAHPNKKWMQTSITGGVNKKVLANKQYKKPTGYTLKSFLETHPVGNFVLVVEGHAVAIVNGVLFGNSCERFQELYRSVWYGFQMK